MNIGWIHISLNDVQDRDVATFLSRDCRDHSILRLEESTHHIQNGSFANCLCLFDVVARERCIGGHQEMASRSWYQGGDNADKVVVHISWVSKGGSTC